MPGQISLAVGQLTAANKDPMAIRTAVISRMKEHRQRFVKHINRLLRTKGFQHDIADTWDVWYVNKLRNELDAAELLLQLNGGSVKYVCPEQPNERNSEASLIN